MISFIFVAILAAVAVSSITFILGVKDGRQHVINQLQSVVTLKQAEIESWVNLLNVNMNLVVSGEENSGDVQILNSTSQGGLDYQEAYNRILNRFDFISGNLKLFDELFIMDTDGVVRLSTNSAYQNQKHAVEDYFINGLKGPYIEQPSYSLSSGKMLVVVSAPIVQNGKVVGVMGGKASLQSLNEIMLERTGLGNTGETYLVGSNHHLLTGLRNEKYTIPDTYISSQGSKAAVDSHESGYSTYLNYAGHRVFGVYQWVPELQVALLAEQQEGEALHATTSVLEIIAMATALTIVLAILAARYITSSITRPVAELAATATLITKGDLYQQAKIERDDEVGILAAAFNSMTTQLRDQFRHQELRTLQLRAINEVGRHISAILQIDELLKYVASSLQNNFKYQNIGIILRDQDSGQLELRYAAGTYEGGEERSQLTPVVNSVAQNGQALLVNDLQNDPVLKRTNDLGHTRAELAVPINIGDKLIGIMDIEADQPLAFNEFDVFTIQALADQIAIALENIRLYEQAQELATMKERSRLARDLHDAVSQTLFSASIISEVLPRLWEKNQEEGRRRLEEIRQLTRGALAEMRTLLFELQPAALADAELAYLLHQLAESITGRTRITVKVLVEGKCELPPNIKVALYRITQEALNNVAKHANATIANIKVTCQSGVTELSISDNGKGFDTAGVRPESLGLGIMRDRAQEIGADIEIQSVIGSGTTVTVRRKET
jgi:signal transduction histidine kinase